MCLGLNTDCLAYCDTDVDVIYKNAPKKQHFCPSRVILIEECSHHNSSGTPMHCKSKKVQQLKKWLIANPIMDEADVKFLRLEESKFCQSLVAAVSEHQQQAELHSESGASWIGPKPFLWLAHVLLEEDVIVLFRKAHEWGGRDETDARNAADRPPTWAEVAATIYCNRDIDYTTMCFPDLHNHFHACIELKGSEAPQSTPDKIKEKVAHVRCEIMEMVDRWERSGNGEGQRAQDSQDFGHIVEDQLWLAPGSHATDPAPTYMDGDNRRNFLNGKGSYLLYMWQVWDESQIFNRVMSIIPSASSASSDGVPVTITTNTGRHRSSISADDDPNRNVHVGQIADSMSRLADANAIMAGLRVQAHIEQV